MRAVSVGRDVPVVLLAAAMVAATPACFSLLTDTGGLEGTRVADTGVDAVAEPPRLDKKYTEVLGRFVGRPPSPSTSGLRGIDLGVTFPAQSGLTTLFGDTQGTFGNSFAVLPRAFPSGDLPPVKWPAPSATPLVRALGSAPAGMVPVEGLSVAGATYVFFGTTSDPETGRGRLALERSTSDLSGLTLDFVRGTDLFVNVSAVQDSSASTGEKYAWIFGSSPLRRAVFLAKAPLASLGDLGSWRYLGKGSFGSSETDASPLIEQACVRELSVRRHEATGLWIMAHTCGDEPGVFVRTARSATGPWSAPIKVMDPYGADGGLGRTMHASRSEVGQDDGLSDGLAHIDDKGNKAYGPYLVPEWFDAPAANAETALPERTFAIVYTMSTLNPYTVWLMRTVLGDPSVRVNPVPKGKLEPTASLVNGDFGMGLSGWKGTMFNPFQVIDVGGGRKGLTTKAPLVGSGATGALWQDFTVDSKTKALRFSIFGGEASVKLLRGSEPPFEVLRESWGSGSDALLLPVVWNLEDHRGETLRLLIEDNLMGVDGYVGVADFMFERDM